MRRAFQTFFCVLAALYLVGGHWGVLQVVAWSQMLSEYSQDAGLLGGIQETFSGEKPCNICRKIQDGKNEEKKQAPVSTDKAEQLASKWLTPSADNFLPAANWREANQTAASTRSIALATQWLASIPTPPPRALA